MVLRALPTPYRIGTDICRIPRIRRILSAGSRGHASSREESSHFRGLPSLDDRTNKYLEEMSGHLNPYFLARLFRPGEIAALAQKYGRVANTMSHDSLWAAKEAIIKAASQSYVNEDGSYRKPTFQDIFIWSSKGRVKAAILRERVRGGSVQVDASGPGSSSADAKKDEESIQAIQEKTSGAHGDELFSDEDVSQLDGDMVEISISHDKDYAIATALFCDPIPK
ncbi:hypothetical protein, variant [Verruconis gallopava]|uniref:Uncharacterized protein n=1 Tax=Verruconis gallopava TaxID=253628 RepID=A0A0D2AGN5_9PEZI|nr:hypothetical protein, variant [Verruconis gallopava]KIW06073.1 hypothetical protein, variant [Verruconis gallopava]